MNTIAEAFGIGTIIGIVLFFVMVRLGWIDKLIDSIDKRFR
jgi:ABC-type nitrate/sulfonate/bicarbonate transport system permease component